jgi:glycerol-3-phosphate dehydrogenase
MHRAAAGLSPRHADHLARRYGTLALRVLDLVAEDPELGAPLDGAETYLAAEVRFAVLNEAALHVDDVLTRRTHIAFEAQDRGRRAVEHVARVMAPALEWDEDIVNREIEHYRSRLDAESAAQRMLDDAGADAARAPVRDVRLEHGGGAAR